MSLSDELDVEIGEGAAVFASTGHHYAIAPAPYRRHRISLADPSGTILHVDQFDVSSDIARQRFVKSAGETLSGSGPMVRRELKLIAANIERILPERPRTAASFVDNNPYTVTENGIFYERVIPNSPEPIETQISNFGARIIQDVSINDGQEDRREFKLEAWQGSTRRTLTVSAERFESLKWAVDHLGANAVVFPGPSAIQHVVAAIKLESDPERRSVYGHTGWRELDDGTMGYLTASGAITADGLRSDVGVHLPPPLDSYLFPEPPTGDDLVYSLKTWLAMLDVADESVTIPMFCALLRSVLAPADFVLFLKGATGYGKSQLAALVQSSFGPAFTSDNLPANFSSTANAIEMTANLAKDAVLVVDDFQRNPTANVDMIAERIGRAVGNQAGRARLNRESQLQKQRPPRGTVIMTGEDTPRGESLRARMSIVEMPRNGMKWGALKQAQKAAKHGLYAAAMSGFIKWLATDYDERQTQYRERFEAIRDQFMGEQTAHHKTTQTMAQMMTAWTLFLDFLESTHAFSADVLGRMSDTTERVLRELISAQADHLGAADPVMQFLDGLESMVASGKGHFANRYGEEPKDHPESWGWRKFGTSEGQEWRPRGVQLGWIADRGVYVDMTTVFTEIQKHLASANNALPIQEQTLIKRLNERGYLLSKDEKRQTFKIRRELESRQRNVIHLQFPFDDDVQTELPGMEAAS